MVLSIPERNLEKMLGLEKGDMRYQLCTGESIGARGSYNGLECAGVNFYYDRDTGEILEFTNAVIEGENILSGLFQVTVEVKGDKLRYRIVGAFMKGDQFDHRTYSEEAEENIRNSILLYNLAMNRLFVEKASGLLQKIRDYFLK